MAGQYYDNVSSEWAEMRAKVRSLWVELDFVLKVFSAHFHPFKH